VPVFSIRIASKLMVRGELAKCQIWFHSMIRAGAPLKVVNSPRTIGLLALLTLLPIQSDQSGAMAACAGLVVRFVLENALLALPKVIRPLELAKSWLLPE